MPNRTTEARDEKLARATLLALRMTLLDPDEGGDLGYCLMPHQAPLGIQDITSALAAMEKPVTCIGVGVGGLLGVGCWPLPAEDLRIRDESAYHRESMDKTAYQNLVDDSGTANILLLGFKENLLLFWDEYLEWQRQYFLYTFQSHLRPASPPHRALGAQAVLQITGIRKNGGSGGGMTKVLPDPMGGR